MQPDELREILDFLRQRVHLHTEGTADSAVIRFDPPSLDDMAAAGLNPEGSQSVLAAPWWDEMVAEVVETPEWCEPEETPEQVLTYARDVVSEYIRKRATL